MIFLFLSWLQARLAESAIYTKITHFGQLNQEYWLSTYKKRVFFRICKYGNLYRWTTYRFCVSVFVFHSGYRVVREESEALICSHILV